MEHKKYIHIERLGSEDVEGIEMGECFVFPKIDGCFDYKTQVLLSDGSREEIGKIVNQKMDVEVLSYDFNNKTVCMQKITDWHKYPCSTDEWLTITVQRTAGGKRHGGGRNTQLLVTKNHHFIKNLDGGTIEAMDIVVGDELFVIQDSLSPIQEQVLLGTLLGDGSCYPNKPKSHINGICLSHSAKQRDYINHLIRLLGDTYKSTRNTTSGYGSVMLSVNTKCDKRTQLCYDIAYRDYKKKVNSSWLRKLNSLGIAIWYMDDGSLIKGISDRCMFSTDGFSEEENGLICKFFNDRGYECYLAKNGRGGVFIKMTPAGTINLFTDIRQHIIPSLQYKISAPFRGGYIDPAIQSPRDALIKRRVVSVTDGKKESYFKQGMFKYDLTIENTHVYFAGNVLSHNSNASLWYTKEDKKFHAGSRNRELTIDNDNHGFMEWFLTAHDNQNKGNIIPFLRENSHLRLFGEWLVKHTLRTYRDDAWRKFYIFDVFDMNINEYLHYDTYKELLDRYRIGYIPPICKISNPSYERLMGLLEQNTYLIKDGQGTGEGIVIKNYSFKNKYGRTVWAKIVKNEFKDAHWGGQTTEKKEKKMVEEEIVNKYVTSALVEKEYAKIASEGWSSKKIPQLLNVIYHCLVKEEMWDIVKKFKNPTINFRTLSFLTTNRIKKLKPELF